MTTGVVHEIGLRRLAHRQAPLSRRLTRRRSRVFYAGLVTLVLVVSGPLERWSMAWLSVHMVLHILEMFYIPPVLIVGGPWVPLMFALPVERRRRLLQRYYRTSSLAWVRGLRRFVSHPITATIVFNTVMVLWHVPAVFNWADQHDWTMNWLMAPSFLLVGLLFWRIVLPSHPWPPRGTTIIQVGAIVVTALEMLVLAMAMSIFAKTPWYAMNIAMHGPAAAMRDQQYAAGILWVCGDFWAAPALALVAYRLVRSADHTSDRALPGVSTRSRSTAALSSLQQR